MSQQIGKAIPKYSALHQRTQQEENLIKASSFTEMTLLVTSHISQTASPITSPSLWGPWSVPTVRKTVFCLGWDGFHKLSDVVKTTWGTQLEQEPSDQISSCLYSHNLPILSFLLKAYSLDHFKLSLAMASWAGIPDKILNAAHTAQHQHRVLKILFN